MDPTQIPQKGIDPGAVDPNAIKAILAKLFGTAVKPGAPTFPATGGAAPAQGTTPAGMTQPPAAAAAAPQPGGNPPAPAGITAAKPGPTGGGAPLPANPKPSQAADPAAAAAPLSESDYTASNPGPKTQPYVEPDMKHRMLQGLFAGMQNVGQPGSGSQMLNQYLDRIYQGEERNRTAPADEAAAAHQRYMSYIEGQKGPLSVEDMQQELADRRAAAAVKPTGPNLEQQYADAIAKGDQSAADKALTAMKGEAGAKARPVIESLAQRYADAVEKGDTEMATRLLEGMRAQSKSLARPPAEHGPTSEGGMAYADWRRQNPHAPVSDYFNLKNAPKDKATQAKNIDDLRKERDAVQKNFEARITAVTTSPEDAKRLQVEEQQQLGTYDRHIHNFEQGYKEGDVVPYTDPKTGKQGDYKITRILPDGRLQLTPEKKK